jgi:hypothetical protein
MPFGEQALSSLAVSVCMLLSAPGNGLHAESTAPGMRRGRLCANPRLCRIAASGPVPPPSPAHRDRDGQPGPGDPRAADSDSDVTGQPEGNLNFDSERSP